MLKFLKKHQFPFHLVKIAYLTSVYFSTAFWSVWVKSRLLLLRCTFGKGLKADGRVYIRTMRANAISIGDHLTVNSRFASNLVGITQRTAFQCIEEGKITIGHHCGFTSVIISSRQAIQVGDHVVIGGNVRIYDHDYHALDPMHRRTVATDAANCKSAPVTIGNDVFIGTNATILKGVTIGDRSVIGAGAVVALRNIPPDSMVVGNPARIVPAK